jgi:hypothetical protein
VCFGCSSKRITATKFLVLLFFLLFSVWHGRQFDNCTRRSRLPALPELDAGQERGCSIGALVTRRRKVSSVESTCVFVVGLLEELTHIEAEFDYKLFGGLSCANENESGGEKGTYRNDLQLIFLFVGLALLPEVDRATESQVLIVPLAHPAAALLLQRRMAFGLDEGPFAVLFAKHDTQLLVIPCDQVGVLGELKRLHMDCKEE